MLPSSIPVHRKITDLLVQIINLIYQTMGWVQMGRIMES